MILSVVCTTVDDASNILLNIHKVHNRRRCDIQERIFNFYGKSLITEATIANFISIDDHYLSFRI